MLYCYATPVRFTHLGVQMIVTQAPAIINAVYPDGTCRLNVLGPRATFGSGGYEVIESASMGGPNGDVETPGTWMWPPRV